MGLEDLLLGIGLGVAMGLSLAAPPGPVNALIATEAAKSPLHGTSVGVGAMTADAVFMTITLIIGRFLPSFVIHSLFLAGGGVMLYLAYDVWRSKGPSGRGKKGNFVVGLGMGLSNPFQITWWLTAGLFMIREISLTTIPGFFAGILLWIFSFPLTIHKIRARYKYIKYASATILLLFGAYMLYIGVAYALKTT
nr:LysE family transporter [Sulfodiicoccus acidiphilus]